MYTIFVQKCVIRPQYSLLERAYNDYRINSTPCQGGVSNQCAVRMSIALVRAGFGLESFQPHNRVHSGNGACHTDGVPHVVGAEELARFLQRALAEPTIYRRSRGRSGHHSAFEQVRGTRGILYFNNCFQRAGQAGRRGDHIDLFNGEEYYNQIIHPNAGGDETTGGNLFRRADAVWFWQLA